MKTILVVDDDARVRDEVQAALSAHDSGFSVLLASDGLEALRWMVKQKVDLVLTDLHMPLMDGFQLLAGLMNYNPGLPVVVMSSTAVEETQSTHGAPFQVHRVSKPLEIQTLVSRVRACLRERAHGQRRGVTLPGFLQLLHQEHKTGLLEVRAGERTGLLHMLGGELVHAQYKEAEGETALFRMLSWREPRVRMYPALPHLRVSVSSRMDQLLAGAVGLNGRWEAPESIVATRVAPERLFRAAGRGPSKWRWGAPRGFRPH